MMRLLLSFLLLLCSPLLIPITAQNPWELVIPGDPELYHYGSWGFYMKDEDTLLTGWSSGIRSYSVSTGNATFISMPESIFAIDGAAGQVWAAGWNGLVMHQDINGVWRQVATGMTRVSLRGVYVRNVNDVWIPGGTAEEQYKTSVLLHWDGVRWTKMIENQYLTVINAYARNNKIWLTGIRGTILHSKDSGKSWSKLSDGPLSDSYYGIWGASSPATATVYFVGQSLWRLKTCTWCLCSLGINCKEWLATPERPGDTGWGILSVIGYADNSHLYVSGSIGFIGRWDGTKLIRETLPQAVAYTSFDRLRISPTRTYIYAAGDNGAVVRKKIDAGFLGDVTINAVESEDIIEPMEDPNASPSSSSTFSTTYIAIIVAVVVAVVMIAAVLIRRRVHKQQVQRMVTANAVDEAPAAVSNEGSRDGDFIQNPALQQA